MHFSKTSEYSIRVLCYLHRYNNSIHTVKILHKELNLPYKYLTKIMTILVKKGLVSASKGRTGGLKLTKDANKIRLCDILEATDDSFRYKRCILGFEDCDSSNPCALHLVWSNSKESFEDILTHTTLDSLLLTNGIKL